MLVEKALADMRNKGFATVQSSLIEVIYNQDGTERVVVVRLFMAQRYAQWQDEFTQVAPGLPAFEALIHALAAEGWETNLD